MSNRSRSVDLSQYDLSRIHRTTNNKLVDLGESFLALLADVPVYRDGADKGLVKKNNEDELKNSLCSDWIHKIKSMP